MKNVLRSLCVLLLLFFTLNCDDDDPIQYQLTTEASPKEGGSVSPAPASYNEGTEVEITATANDEYVFKNWTGDGSGDENPMKVMMTDDMVITAEFEKVQYTMDIVIMGGGNVTQEILQAKSTSYPSGTQVKLTAVPFPGWQFAFWEGDAEGQENPLEITMTKSMNITVFFEPVEETYVPDDNFESALIELGLDRLMDDHVFDLYAAEVEELDLSGLGIKDLTGIEAFTNLKELNCSNNDLSSIDLSQNRYIEDLNLSNNKLISIDLSKNLELASLDLSNNSLEAIDLTNNKNLYVLILSHNALKKLDISHLTEWINLWADNNSLTCIQIHEDTLNSHTIYDCTPPPYLPPSPYAHCIVVDDGVTFSLDCSD